MTKEEKVSLKFLEHQLELVKEKDRILEKMESTLYEMKKVAEYAASNKLDPFERNKLSNHGDGSRDSSPEQRK